MSLFFLGATGCMAWVVQAGFAQPQEAFRPDTSLAAKIYSNAAGTILLLVCAWLAARFFIDGFLEFRRRRIPIAQLRADQLLKRAWDATRVHQGAGVLFEESRVEIPTRVILLELAQNERAARRRELLIGVPVALIVAVGAALISHFILGI